MLCFVKEVKKVICMNDRWDYPRELVFPFGGEDSCHELVWLDLPCFGCGCFDDCERKVFELARERGREKGAVEG